MVTLVLWFAHILGLDNLSGPWYGFWSGVGGDLSLFTVAYALVRRHNCHVQRCWRIGRHPVDGGYLVCARHHPFGPPTHQDVIDVHEGR